LLKVLTFAAGKVKVKKLKVMKRIGFALLVFVSLHCWAGNDGDSIRRSRLSVGGYGEAVFSRNYYSDHVSRYSQPEEHKDDPSHGRFDIPHAVIYLGYDFGKGWTARVWPSADVPSAACLSDIPHGDLPRGQ